MRTLTGSGLRRPPRFHFVALTELDASLSHPSHRGIHGMDVMGVWGGKGGASKISIRKCLNTGHNFDLVTGADLTKYHNQQMLLKYVRTHQPLVVVMGPPCAAFGNWSHINQYNAPDAYAASRITGETLARLAARIASVQFASDRHFILENPRGSEMSKLPALRALWNTGRIHAVNSPVCHRTRIS